jgi:peptidyl-tRNA hydrolase
LILEIFSLNLITKSYRTFKINPMHAYFRNHQLYLAERSEWLDRHVLKTSKRALMKIESWKLIAQSGDQDNQLRLVEKLVKESLLTPIPNSTVLHKEGFYLSNLDN